jgi:uncharacterized protein YegP (UPF0339 family)
MSDLIKETPAKPTRVVEYYLSTNGTGWFWRVRNIKNNKIVLTGAEGYSKKGNVLRAINKETSNWFPGSFTGPNEVIT